MLKPKEKTTWQSYLSFSLIFIVIYFIVFKLEKSISEEYHAYFALCMSIIFFGDILFLFYLKKRGAEEQKGYYLFLSMGLILLLISVFLIYTNIQPGIWISSFSFLASFLTSAVVYQFLQNRKFIL